MTTSASDSDCETTISAADANRGFSRLLREVREGASFVVTAHGRPVARVTPYTPPQGRREAAREALFKRLREQEPMNIPIDWTRSDLHDED